MKQFVNKVAIVTGGASGIGKSICVYLARHGTKVIIADHNLDGAQETESFITSNGGYGKAVCIDVSNPQDMESLIENTMKDHSQIDFIFNNAGIGIGISDKNRTFSMVNNRLVQMLGTSKDELIGVSHLDITHPEDIEKSRKGLETLFLGETDSIRMEKRYIRKDGNYFWVDLSVSPIPDEEGNVAATIGILADITERKRTEEALRESEEFSSSLLENSPNPLIVFNQDTSIKYVNPMLEELTGFTSAEVIGKKAPYPWWTDDPEFGTIDQRKQNISKRIRGLERLFRKKNGEPFWVEMNNNPIFRNGELKYRLTTWVDITERKRSEESLRNSEKRFRKLIEQSPVIYEMYDRDGVQRMVNSAYGKLWGIDPKSTVGTFNVRKTKQGDKLRPYLDRAYSGETVVLPNIQWDPQKEIGEGRERWISTIIYPLQDSDGDVENIVI